MGCVSDKPLQKPNPQPQVNKVVEPKVNVAAPPPPAPTKLTAAEYYCCYDVGLRKKEPI